MELYHNSHKVEDVCSSFANDCRIVDNHGAKAAYMFSAFGNGSRNTSAFRVYVSWSDVESMILKFAESGFGPAQKIQSDHYATAEQ